MVPGERLALKGLRILVVDDAPEILDALGLLLAAEGADVVAVAHGRAALDAARRGVFDVVVTDLGLPDIPGELLVREFLAMAPRPRVIAMTGFGPTRQSNARTAGAESVLVKPFDWSMLRAQIVPREPSPGETAA